MSFKQSSSLENTGQSIGCDPKSAKRNSGLFAFLKWFKPSASRESITAEPQISQSSSCDSLNSTHSVGTVASFSFVPPSDYKKCVSEKCIALGPETDTYKARLKQRDKRKENDKNLTLRKKYNLFFNRDTLLKPKTLEIDEENSKSLPLMTRGGMESVEVHRRTISESSNIRRVSSHSHVKGKRKAPQPPSHKVSHEGMSTASLRRTKRLAPIPPAVSAEKLIKSINIVDKTDSLAYEDLGIICNDSLKLDNGILKSVKDLSPNSKSTEIEQTEQNENLRSAFLNPSSKSTVETPVSPRPWYKRNTSRDSVIKKDKTENKYEPIERLPEVPFSRNSSLDLTLDEIQDEKRRDEKRKSGMSFLTNISELDREACEIMKSKEQVKNNSTQMGKIPEFMRPRDIKMNMDSWVSPKRRSARDLIAKFNAITNVTKATVFGASQRDTQPIGKQRSLDETKRQEQVLESHQKTIEEIDKKKIPIAKSESTNTVTPKPETPKLDKKSWVCPKCNIGNDYWRIICHVCSSIKPYFDDLSVSLRDEQIPTKCSSPLITRKDKYIPQKLEIERSKTQIEFSALASYNGKVKANQSSSKDGKSQKEMDHKKEQREKLRKMLIDMKNSLPKRKTNAFQKQNSKKSILEDSIELTEDPAKNEDIEESSNGKPDAAKNTEIVSYKTQEEKIAEILIGNTQTIYENIKVKKTDNPKLMKVSSSAQTSGVVKQLVPTSTIANLIKNQNKHNNYELMRPKDFENIYSDSNSKSAATVYANLSRNHELSLFFNMPKNLKKETSNTDTLRINVLLKKLENSISEGELKDAAIFAEELAQLRVNCSVIRQKPKVLPEVEKRRIHVEMYVEDKISHRGPFPVVVNPDQTVAQLKAQIEKEFEIPAAYQKWILGKELVTDEKSTLKDHNITSEGCPVFLYLVAPELDCDNIQKKAVNREEPKQSTSRTGIEIPKTETREGGTYMKNEIDTVKNNVRDLQNILNENRNKLKNSDSSSIDHAPKIVNVIRKTTENSSKDEVTVIPIEVESSNRKEISNLTKTEKLLTTTEIKIKIEHNPPKLLKNPNLEVKPKIQYVFPTIQNSYQHSSIEKEPSVEPRKVQEITPTAESSKVSKRKLQEIAPTRKSSCSKDPPKAEDEDELEYYEAKTLKPSKEWECHLCTLLNPISSNVCAVCATVRIKKLEGPTDISDKVKRKAPQPKRGEQSSSKQDQTYLQLVNLDNSDLVENNVSFECMICFLEIPPNEGVTLRECLHQFCKVCLAHTIEFADEAEVKCPYRDDIYSCTIALQDREIKALVIPNIYEQHLAKSIAQAENKIDKSFHCKTPDCKGWCIFEDNVNEFRCPVCHKLNCLTCQAVHAGLNCKQYQERMNAASEIDDEAKRTKDMLEEMVNKGEAIECPTCRVILMKKWGCDWLRCSMCKTEICWVTRGPRWGPAGKGDTTGGCQCGVNGVKCHPKCNYCH